LPSVRAVVKQKKQTFLAGSERITAVMEKM